jgi:hypothetical protein
MAGISEPCNDTTTKVVTLRAAPRGALLVLWGTRVVCMRDIFILKEILTRDKIFILAGTWIG